MRRHAEGADLVQLGVALAQAEEDLRAVGELGEPHLEVALVVAEDLGHGDADEDTRGVTRDAQTVRAHLGAGDALGVDDDRGEGLGLGVLRAQAPHAACAGARE